MTAIAAFDVHKYIKKAKELGSTEELAELQARSIEQAIGVAISNINIENKELANKTDISGIQADITLVRAEIRETKLRLKMN